MNLLEIAQQFRGATLPQLVEKHIKTQKEGILRLAIEGTYENFSIEIRPQISEFTLDYTEKWFRPSIITADLGDVFNDTIQDIRDMAQAAAIPLSDEQVFDVFNLIVMRVSVFAHSTPYLRKKLGIKKGWFS